MMILFYDCSYALFHASRKTLSGVKASLIADWTHNSSMNGSHFYVRSVFKDLHFHCFLTIPEKKFSAMRVTSRFYAGCVDMEQACDQLAQDFCPHLPSQFSFQNSRFVFGPM